MKNTLIALLAVAASATASAGTDVGVSIGINQPGVYGRIDIGRVPVQPVYVYPQPVVIAPAPYAVDRRPIYLHVPPGHSRDWRRYCGQYGACGQPVYFVREDWYQRHYAHGPWREGDRYAGRGHDDRGWRDHDRDGRDGRGHGNGRGNGHGNGHGRGHDRDGR